MRKLRYRIEYVVTLALLRVFGMMNVDAASATGGFIMRVVGPRLAVSRKALRHIALALPALDDGQRRAAVRAMWDNIGRTMAEMPHLRTICATRVELVNGGIVRNIPAGGAAILYGTHLANWEIFMPFANEQMGLTMAGVYRAPNNPHIARLLEKMRDPEGGRIPLLPKSRRGARDIVRMLRDNICIGLLIDQKYNEGIAVPFFGHPAMTSPAFVELGQKFDVPVIGARIERLGGAHFRMTIHEPLLLRDGNGDNLPAATVIAQAHGLLEQWIAERPGQWLWLHRRWPRTILTEDKHD